MAGADHIGRKDCVFLARSFGLVFVEEGMKTGLAVLATVLLTTLSAAAHASCDDTAKDKKLAGAALKSFMTKCEKDAATTCAAEAKAKNLHGAAEKSFSTKCVKDATGH